MTVKWKLLCAGIALLTAIYGWVRREQESISTQRYKAEEQRALKFIDPSRAWKH